MDEPRAPRRPQQPEPPQDEPPLTVQDLVDRVDSERTVRRRGDTGRHASPPDPDRAPERPPRHAGPPPRPAEERPQPNAGRPPQHDPGPPPQPNVEQRRSPEQPATPAPPPPGRAAARPPARPPRPGPPPNQPAGPPPNQPPGPAANQPQVGPAAGRPPAGPPPGQPPGPGRGGQPGPGRRPASPADGPRRTDRPPAPAARSRPPGPPGEHTDRPPPPATRSQPPVPPPGPHGARTDGDRSGPVGPPPRPGGDVPPGRGRPRTESRAAVPPGPGEPAREKGGKRPPPVGPPPPGPASADDKAGPTTALPQPPNKTKGGPRPDGERTTRRSRLSRSTQRGGAAAAAPVTDNDATDVLSPLDDSAGDSPPGRRTDTGGWPTSEPLASEAAGKSKRRSAARSRRDRKLRIAGRAGVAFCSVLALLITGGGWSYLRATNNGFTQVSALAENEDDVIDAQAQLGDENYLIVGTDTRAGANAEIGAGTVEDAEGARADTTMLVHIPENRQRVVVVSFPRDLDVTRPECQAWDNQKPGYTEETYPSAMGDKLNAVYALGGPRCLVSTVQRLTGSTINHFIGIDFAGFEQMVDTLGGVEVCSSRPVEDGMLGTIIPEAGKQVIDGQTALKYVRARHVTGEERSDYDRIARQQKFLASLLREALSGNVLLDPAKLNGFVKAFTNATFVDRVQPNDLLMLGQSLRDLESGAVTFLTVPTAGTTSYGNEIPRTSDIQAIFQAIRDDQPLPGEKTAPAPPPTSEAPVPPSLTAVAPGTLSLLVSNGSGISGLAGTTASELSSAGFGIYNVGNYTQGNATETKVRYAPGHESEAATVASAIPGAAMEIDDSLDSIVELVLGEDYQQVVNTPAPVGSSITDVPRASTTPAELPSDLEHVNAADDLCAT